MGGSEGGSDLIKERITVVGSLEYVLVIPAFGVTQHDKDASTWGRQWLLYDSCTEGQAQLLASQGHQYIQDI